MSTILLADDDDSLRSLLARAMRRCGWTVVEAQDGARALRAALESPPDVAALDARMPVMDGCGVCRALRRDPRTRRVAVLLLTGAPSEELPRLDPPPDAVLAKPLRLADLVRTAQSLLSPAPGGEERCAECGAAIAVGGGRFRNEKTVCVRCHDAGRGGPR